MERRNFIKALGMGSLAIGMFSFSALDELTNKFKTTARMPALFVGHGHPINAILDTPFTRKLKKIGEDIERPQAIMVISAHWETSGTYVSVNPNPKTIYDFGRFDERLFQIKYEPQGHPELAKSVRQLNTVIQEDHGMGLDHGTWTILKHIFPKADIPVFQLSIDARQKPVYHYQLAKSLKTIREKGVMVMGSGNIVHNLGRLNWRDPNAKAHDWVIEFDEAVKQRLNEKQFEDLIHYQNLGQAAMLSIPTNEHYLPMLYVLGVMEKGEKVEYLYEAYEYASLSMRSFMIS